VLAFANSSKESDSGTGCNLFAGHVALLPNDIRIRKLQSSATIWGGESKMEFKLGTYRESIRGLFAHACNMLFNYFSGHTEKQRVAIPPGI